MKPAFENTMNDIFYNIFEINIKDCNDINNNKLLAFYLKLFEKYLGLTKDEINKLLE